MSNVVEAVGGTPLPTILVILGTVFLLIAIIGQLEIKEIKFEEETIARVSSLIDQHFEDGGFYAEKSNTGSEIREREEDEFWPKAARPGLEPTTYGLEDRGQGYTQSIQN